MRRLIKDGLQPRGPTRRDEQRLDGIQRSQRRVQPWSALGHGTVTSSTLKACVCGNLSRSWRCRSCAEKDSERRNTKGTAYGYNRAHWQRIRKQRLTLARGLCELQLPGCTIVATHVHLAPELNGNHDAATLADTQAYCPSCSGAIDAPHAQPTRGQVA